MHEGMDGDEVFTRAQARAAGLTDRQVTARLASGALTASRRGVLRRRDDDPNGKSSTTGKGSAAGAGSAHGGPDNAARGTPSPVPLEVRAALLASPRRELVISHATAARILGLPRPLAGWPEPQFTATSGPTRHRNGLQVKVAPLADAEVVEHLGLRLTSPARTVADCLRTVSDRDALAMVDAALHRRLVVDDSVLEVLLTQAGWPGVTNARKILALADGRRESPLESWSAWAFASTAVPAPAWQVEIREPDGRLIGRADCWWGAGVVGEADGRSKYALAAAEQGGNSAAVFQVLQAERRREQRLRDVGADVVRWSSGEVLKPTAARQLAARIRAAISQAHDAARFTGVVAPAPAMLPVSTSKPP